MHARGRQMGRPTKYSDTVVKRITNALERGATYKLAARAGGISYKTFCRWRNNKPAFAEKVAAAEWRAADQWLEAIDEAAESGSWRAAAWKLERRYPNQYGSGRDRGTSGTENAGDEDGRDAVIMLPDNGRVEGAADPSRLTDDELDTLLALQEKMHGKGESPEAKLEGLSPETRDRIVDELDAGESAGQDTAG